MIKFSERFAQDDVPFKDVIYDRMTENIVHGEPDLNAMFAQGEPAPLEVIDFTGGSSPIETLKAYNKKHGLALDQLEMEYLVDEYSKLGSESCSYAIIMAFESLRGGIYLRRQTYFMLQNCNANCNTGSPTDIEIFMFGQVNSEHCRRRS